MPHQACEKKLLERVQSRFIEFSLVNVKLTFQISIFNKGALPLNKKNCSVTKLSTEAVIFVLSRVLYIPTNFNFSVSL